MKKTKSMDLFGKALKAYSQGDRSAFYLKDSDGNLHRIDLSRYFRKPNQFLNFEKKLISLAYGEILDVGCGTGNYISLLAKRGKVSGIDISPAVIEVAKNQGCKNCRVADIFTYRPKKKYDTITFLGNGLGIGGTPRKTVNLLKKLSGLLKDDGQILAIGRRVAGKEFVNVSLRPVWKNKTGSSFNWIHLNREFLSRLCQKANLDLATIQGNQHYFLFRIFKQNE